MAESNWHTLLPNASFRLDAGCANIVIHRWAGPHGWRLTCKEAHYDAHPLDTDSLEQAKRAAVALVRARLRDALEALDKESEDT